MDRMKNGAANKKYFIMFLILWAAQMAAAFYFCTQKQGFHEDELYTYYSTARTNGFYVENGKWMDRETYRNEFVVLPGERFRYGLVKEVQSWDVHPPMYYWVFHTVASFVPGVFSKWIGLSVNLFFHGINLVLLAWLTYLVSNRDGRMAILVNLVYGFSPAAMSGVVFIRMYEMLTTFVLLCAIVHIRVVIGCGDGRARQAGAKEEGAGFSLAEQENGESFFGAEKGNYDAHGPLVRLPIVTLLLMAIVTYLGFLTQYYYFIFLFFLAGTFCLWLLWRDRKIGNCLRYGLAQGIAFVLAYLTYPAFPGQMFRGQRGAQATKNFFDLSNTFERLAFFFDLMNGYVFGYFFLVLLLVVAVLAVCVCVQGRKKMFTPAFWMLLFAAAGYFIAVSKTALLLGNTSNRYQLPIYGIVVLLVFAICKTLWSRAVSLWGERCVTVSDGDTMSVKKAVSLAEDRCVTGGEGKRMGRLYRLCPAVFKVLLPVWERIGGLWDRFVDFLIKHRKITEKAAVAFCLAIVVSGYLCVDVVFLYPRGKEERAIAQKQAAEGIPVVYVYKPGEEWCIWSVADVLMEYERVYFVAADSEELLTEPAIVNTDMLVAYLPLYDDVKEEETQNMRIAASCHASDVILQFLYQYGGSWFYYKS